MITEISTKKQIAKALKDKMKETKMSKAELRRRTGLSNGSMYNLLQYNPDNTNFTIDHLLKVARELGVKIILEY